MPLYKKSSQALVYDLINEANPTLPIPLTPSNTTLASVQPATVSGRPELNTSLVCISKGGDYIGRAPLNYRRLSLNTLFRGITVQINKFSANQSAANSVVFTIYNLLQQINQQYGVNLTTDDVSDANIVRGSTQENGYYTTTVTVTAKSTSLGYVGSFALKWRGDAQDIASMISVTDLNARRFPGGNDFTGNHDIILNNMAYGIDWTAFIAQGKWDGFATDTFVPGSNTLAFGNRFIAEINRLYGTTLSQGSDPAPAYSYNGWNPRIYDLTTDAGRKAAPEANSDYYNRVLMLSPPANAGSGVGTHYIHYNV